jgi:hypothetical protein
MLVRYPGPLDHPDKVQGIVGLPHKVAHAGAVFGVELLLNYQLTCRRLVEFSRAVYVLSDPRKAIPRVMASGLYDQESAARLYCFRLRRLAELARKTTNGLLLTESDLETPEGSALAASFLKVRSEVRPVCGRDAGFDVSGRLMDLCVESYERHFFYMRGLPLRRLG